MWVRAYVKEIFLSCSLAALVDFSPMVSHSFPRVSAVFTGCLRRSLRLMGLSGSQAYGVLAGSGSPLQGSYTLKKKKEKKKKERIVLVLQLVAAGVHDGVLGRHWGF